MKLSILCIAVLVASAAAAPKEAKLAILEADKEQAEVAVVKGEAAAAPAPAPGGCVTDCAGRSDGDYPSCDSCHDYVTCSNERFFGGRPCAANLVWDDNLKRCEWTSPTCVERTQVARGCEKILFIRGTPMSITCEPGLVISVKSAFYGRQQPTSEVCSIRFPSLDNTNCLGDTDRAVEVVRGECEGQTSCEILPTNRLFGYPCIGTYKYLEVEYSCVGIQIVF